MKIIKWVLPLVYIFAFQPLTYADTNKSFNPVQADLIVENETIQAGNPFWVGVKLKMDDGWDTYWQNPGDAGLATQINWQLPEGFVAGPIQWPYPEKFTTDDMVGFGYTDSVLLLTKITPTDQILDQSVELKASVKWLACKDACLPGDADLSITLPVADGAPTRNAAMAAEFDKTRAALPKDAPVKVKSKSNKITLSLSPQSEQFDSVVFIPEQGEVIDYLAPQEVTMSKGGMELSLERIAGSDILPNELKGVVLFSDKGSNVIEALQIDSLLGAPSGELSGFWIALAFAFLGGLILNVMPCVMPVIALKIFSFVKMAHEKRSATMKHGGVFALGVLVSFWVLSGILLLLRAYGQSLGWGFQLQEPVFVVVLAAILFLLGLSLFGVFELGTSLISVGSQGSSSKSPMMGSFMSGVLATLVATPCTGPLLGPALGFALSLSPIKALLIFTGMGLGMSAPYLVFAAFPKLVRFLPKPGNWMITFKHIMGFLMMATVIWLVWVFGAQTSNLAVMVLLVSLLVMAIGAWIFGRYATPVRKKLTRTISTFIALIAIAFGGGSAIFSAKNLGDGEVTQVASTDGWESYSPERVAELQMAGTPVFVDFTAKWCLICQANKVILHSSDITKAFHDNGVVTMMADWTKKDSIITKQLELLGRSGVPVYVLYPGEQNARPYILPQTLTSSTVSDYIHKLDMKN